MIDLKNILSNLPNSPGCYQFIGENDVVIYVGKAKDLKKRVNSYFIKKHDDRKTNVLVSKIKDIKYIVVDRDEDTLLLENNLIKQLQPKYNVLLKDDKTYASIVILNEHYPRVISTRNIRKDGSTYFGPFTSGKTISTILETIHKIYPIRSCNLMLTPDKIAQKKYKVCLEYHLKRCKAPCIGEQSEEKYIKNIENVKAILRGDSNIAINNIYEEMMNFAQKQEFEMAEVMKKKYQLLENYRSKSTIITSINYNIDVYNFEEDDQNAYINYLSVHNGAIIQGYTFEYKKNIEEAKEVLLGMGIMEMRQRFGSKSKEIVIPFKPDIELENIEFTIPQRGDKRKLLFLSEKNVKQYKLDKLKKAESLNPEQRIVRILKTIEKDLQLKELPIHIECFDNSNTQGTNPVAACVVFKMGKPSKRDYRHFNVKTVIGPDDYSSMREIVYRRYHRQMMEKNPLPQLIVVDGGKGQISAACESLKQLGLYGKIAIIGIAEKLEEIYFPEDPIPLYLDKNSESLKVIQHLRDEAHRFGLTFHRNKRSKTQTSSEMDKIKGIGIETKRILINHFKSVKRIKEADFETLEKIIGKSKTGIIKSHFEQKEGEKGKK